MSTLRATLRLAGLTLLTLALLVPALAVVLLNWPVQPLSRGADRLATAALLRLQQLWSRGALAVLGVRLQVVRPAQATAGAVDAAGAAGVADAAGATSGRGVLLVSNHLSYLDIPVLAALGPCRFVAKSEVATWPVFGFLAKVVRVLFIDRRRRRDLLGVGAAISAALEDGLNVVIFPEGTSTQGERVLPFHAGLLEPAAQSRAPCRALAIHYETPEESSPPSGTICWWGDMTLVPHLWKLMSIERIEARVSLAPRPQRDADRKQLAAALHADAAALFRPVRQAPLERPWAEEAAPT